MGDSAENALAETSNAREEGEEWKRKVKMVPKLKDGELKLQCEWGDCVTVSCSMKESFEHVSVHIHQYLLQVLNPQPTALLTGGLCLTCGWRDCGAQILGSIIDFNRHVYFHIFHVRLKYLGAHVARVLNLGVCLLGPQSCNWIPELPDNLQCAWGECQIIFDNPYHFYSHVGHHSTECVEGKGLLKCEWSGCQTSVRDKNKLKEHLRSHTQEKQVACPTCGGLFASQSKLTDHILRQATSQLLRYECSHCNRRFSTERMLREHMRRHVNTYKCQLCEMTCPSPSALRMHVRYKHSDEKPFKCGHCEFSAKSSTDLRKHLDCHNVEDQFSCHIANCPFSARAYNSLALHFKKHHESMDISIPRYICHVCKKVFGRGFTLTHHLKNKHQFQWPPGHSRFRYKLHDDGYLHLQTVRYECADLEEVPPQTSDKSSAKNTWSTRRRRRKRIVATTMTNPQPPPESEGRAEEPPSTATASASSGPQPQITGKTPPREEPSVAVPSVNTKKRGRKRKGKADLPATGADPESTTASSGNPSLPEHLESQAANVQKSIVVSRKRPRKTASKTSLSSEDQTSPVTSNKQPRKIAPKAKLSAGELVAQSLPQKGRKRGRNNLSQVSTTPVEEASAVHSQRRQRGEEESSETSSAQAGRKRQRKQNLAVTVKRNAGRKKTDKSSSNLTAQHHADHTNTTLAGFQNQSGHPPSMFTFTLTPPSHQTADRPLQDALPVEQKRRPAFARSASLDECPPQMVDIHWMDGVPIQGGKPDSAYAQSQEDQKTVAVCTCSDHQDDVVLPGGDVLVKTEGDSGYHQNTAAEPGCEEKFHQTAVTQGQAAPLSAINLQVAEYGDSAEANLHMLGDVALTSLLASKMK